MYARLGRFCFRHRRSLLLVWAGLFVVGILIGGQVFQNLKESNGASSAESVQGLEILDKAANRGLSMVVLVEGPAVDAPATRAAVEGLTARLQRLPDVTGVVNAYNTPDPQLRAKDGRASLVVVTVPESDDVAVLIRVVDAVRATAKDSVPGASVTVGGDLAVGYDGNTTIQNDLARGTMIALPILLIALYFVFRGLRPALLPIIAAFATMAGSLLVLLGMTQVTEVGGYAVDVVILFGLALAVDYSLLMVNRYREEVAAGADRAVAMERSVSAAGHTVTFSALAVAASLAGLFVFRNPLFTTLALGGIATVLVALATALTLIPSLIAVWGPKFRPMQRQSAEDGFFGRLARRVQRRPWLVAGGVSMALVALAIPFLSVNYGSGDPRVLPRDSDSRLVAETLLDRFPGKQAEPIVVVAPVQSGDSRVAAYATQIKALPGVDAVSVVKGLPNTVSAIDVIPTGSTQGDTAQALVQTLRDNRPDFRTYITGQAAFLTDFKSDLATRAPYAFAFIALVTFVLLFLMTGSVLVPVKALIMNVLSLGATFGALVWIFQYGHLSGLLGFDAFGAIELWVPVLVFVFAFGLSMDYEVFLLSRIKECYDECGDNNTSVATGLQRSGRIITSAALLVTIVFLGFAAGQGLGIKEMGLALAIAVVVDATLVRCLLVPATMTLLGDANWWAPAPLRRLHDRIGVSEPASLTVPAAWSAEQPTGDRARRQA